MKQFNKKIILFLLISTMLFMPSQHVAKAENSTTSASQKVIDKLKERLSRELDNETDTEENESNEKENIWLGFFGTLKAYSDKKIQIESAGGIKFATLTDDTVISQTEDRQKININLSELDSHLDSFLLAIGPRINDSEINAQKVSFFLEPENSENRNLVYGTVSEVGTQEIKINQDEEPKSIEVDKNTTLKLNNGSIITIEDVQIEDKIVAIYPTDSDKILAYTMLVIPGRNNPEASENLINASESAEASKSSEQ